MKRKFLERFALVVYSYIVLLLAVVVSLLIFNWLDLDTLIEMTETLITGDISSKVLLGVNALLILLSFYIPSIIKKGQSAYTLPLYMLISY